MIGPANRWAFELKAVDYGGARSGKATIRTQVQFYEHFARFYEERRGGVESEVNRQRFTFPQAA